MLGSDRKLGPCNLALHEEMLAIGKSSSQFLLVNGLPKSGSSYLYNLLNKLTGAKKVFLANPLYRSNEQDLFLPSLIDAASEETVSRHHFRATDQNIGLLNNFNIKPLILTRNIYDVIVSFAENQFQGISKVCKEGESTHFEFNNRYSGLDIPKNKLGFSYSILGYYDESFIQMTEAEQFDYVIATTLPWILNFIASWKNAEKQGQEMLWLSYEQLVNDPAIFLNRVMNFYDINNSKNQNAIIESQNEDVLNNFNKGVTGRGLKLLSPKQVAKIRSTALSYKNYDLSSIGIE